MELELAVNRWDMQSKTQLEALIASIRSLYPYVPNTEVNTPVPISDPPNFAIMSLVYAENPFYKYS